MWKNHSEESFCFEKNRWWLQWLPGFQAWCLFQTSGSVFYRPYPGNREGHRFQSSKCLAQKNICKKPLPKKPWDRDASLPKNFPQKGSLSTGIFFTNAASPTKKPWWEKPHDVATVAPHPRRPKRQDLENTWPMRWGILGRIFGLDFELDVL